MSRGAAKLGRRSRKMRETIAEACKTIEDNQTAQALHGLLSLKAENQDGVITITTGELPLNTQTLTHTDPVVLTPTTPTTPTMQSASATLAEAAQQVIDVTPVTSASAVVTVNAPTGGRQRGNSLDTDSQMMMSLENARICNSEVLNRNRNRLKNSEQKKMKAEHNKNEAISLLKISQLAGLSGAGGPGTKLLIVNTNKLPLNQQTFITTPTGEVIDMSNVQIINAATPIKIANSPANKLLIPSTGADTPIIIQSAASPAKAGTSHLTTVDQSMYKSPLKKRPYREPELLPADQGAKTSRLDESGNVIIDHQQQVMLVTTPNQPANELSAVNMADVASTVYDAYIETVQFTFNNTMSMRQSMTEKLACRADVVNLPDHLATACWKAYEARFNEAITDVVNFAKRIPGFAALETDDQIILIKGGSFEVACVMQASFIDPDREIMLLSGIDSAYTKLQLRNSFLMGSSFVDLLFNFASRFSSFRLTDVETALFCALMLIRPDRGGLTNREKVNKLQEILIQALQTQIDLNHRSEAGLFPKVLMMVSNLRELNGEQRRVLTSLKGQIEFAEGLLAEIFDLAE